MTYLVRARDQAVIRGGNRDKSILCLCAYVPPFPFSHDQDLAVLWMGLDNIDAKVRLRVDTTCLDAHVSLLQTWDTDNGHFLCGDYKIARTGIGRLICLDHISSQPKNRCMS